MKTLKEIGEKRQKIWQDTNIYKVKENTVNQKKFYILDMFPYPSGAGLHVGHPKGFIASDVLGRKKMLEGFSVLHPMGFDTFGLGTENYAIEHKMKPQIVADKNIKTYIKQLEMFGCTYDWDRSVNTADPEYFKWTQWVFLQLYTHYYDEESKQAKSISELEKKLQSEGKSSEEIEKIIDGQRLAYIDYKPINRCPKCMTGLANEDLDDGMCERCGSEVEQKPMRQRVLRITKYADRLLSGLDTLNWDESMKELERNWIGKSEGTQFKMNMKDSQDFFEVYTTRIDTVFGMSFVVMAPEHPLVDKITTADQKDAVEKYKEQAKYKSQLERTELQKEKTGQFTGSYAINPFNGEEIPVYVGDYVLANYGTGVVMAVPAHDERDFEFAKKYGIKIVHVIGPSFAKKHEGAQAKISGYGMIYDEKENKFILGDSIVEGSRSLWMPGGTIEEGETVLEGTIREIIEETGYTDLEFVNEVCCSQSFYYMGGAKNTRRENNAKLLFFKLKSDTRQEKQLTEYEEDAPIIKMSLKELEQEIINSPNKKDEFDGIKSTKMFSVEMLKKYMFGNGAYTEKGVLIDSGEFSELTSDQAIMKMQAWLAERGLGGKKCNYKIQDWVFSRQRYWGEPFPVVFCDHCESKGTINFSNQDTWNGIVNGSKTIETRALNPEEPERFFGNYKEGDSITAVNKETQTTMKLIIKKIYQWKNLKDMWENAGKDVLEKMYWNKNMFEETKTFEDFSAKWNFGPGYIEKIEQNGIVGWEIEKLSSKVVAMKESDLPLLLPDVENYAPTGTEEGPLAAIDEWMNVLCPACGKAARRESNTMPGWAGSSWYWLRYMDNKNKEALVSPEREKFRGSVDVYVGGAEHVTRHMIYARFWQKFLRDIGVVTHDEPFQKYHKVGLIMAEDGRKMSKRWGNVVLPDSIVDEYGSDTLRTYEMFMGPFEQSISWSTNGIKGVKKFLDKIVALKDKIGEGEEDKKVLTVLHQSIKKLTEDIDNFRHNTAVSQLMILVNFLTEQKMISRKVFEQLVILVSPFAPHLAEELWENLGNTYSVFTTAVWPSYDEAYLVADVVTLPVQINGKMRGTLEISKTAGEQDVLSTIAHDEKLSSHLTGTPKKVIYIPGKIINIIL